MKAVRLKRLTSRNRAEVEEKVVEEVAVVQSLSLRTRRLSGQNVGSSNISTRQWIVGSKTLKAARKLRMMMRMMRCL